MLWLWEDKILEVGTSNIFFFWRNEQGEDEVITPKADDTILHGVTRDSAIGLLKNKNIQVTERDIYIKDVIQAIEEGRMYEAFSTGTAVTVGPIDLIGFQGNNYTVPINKDLNAGPLTYDLYNELMDI